MNSRFLIPVLCIGAVAFACGPRPHNEASVTSSKKALAAQSGSLQQQGAPRATAKKSRADSKTPITAELYVRATPESIRLALQVINTTKKRQELTFPSGQTHDFVILDSLDREVWRWGRSRMFTQTIRNRLLSGGETIELEATIESSLPPGRYTARAHLTSENFPLVKQTHFTIAGTTIASR